MLLLLLCYRWWLCMVRPFSSGFTWYGHSALTHRRYAQINSNLIIPNSKYIFKLTRHTYTQRKSSCSMGPCEHTSADKKKSTVYLYIQYTYALSRRLMCALVFDDGRSICIWWIWFLFIFNLHESNEEVAPAISLSCKSYLHSIGILWNFRVVAFHLTAHSDWHWVFIFGFARSDRRWTISRVYTSFYNPFSAIC